MTTDDMIREMRQKRGEHVSTRDFAAKEIAKLDAAIAGLTGENIAVPRSGLTVPEMVLVCCQESEKQNPTPSGVKLTITSENMDDIARVKFPDSVKRIKQGRCNAVLGLIKKNKLKRVPGGFELL